MTCAQGINAARWRSVPVYGDPGGNRKISFGKPGALSGAGMAENTGFSIQVKSPFSQADGPESTGIHGNHDIHKEIMDFW